jgi:hypothetical protein
MAFQVVNYITDAGTIVRIRVSDETVGATGNTAAAGTPDDPSIFAYASNPGSKRKKQLNARGLRLQRFTGTGAARKRFTTFLPFFTKAAFDDIAIGQEYTLKTVAWVTYDKVNECPRSLEHQQSVTKPFSDFYR